jgi:hypothetical protein
MLKPGGKERSSTEALIQALVAMALLIGLPLLVGTPETIEGMAAAFVAAFALFAFLLEGVARFIRNRRRPYPDSILPPPPPADRKLPTATRED